MSTKVTIWVPRSSGHSYEEAEMYGEIKELFPKHIRGFSLEEMYQHLIELEEDGSISEHDILLPSGPLTFNMIAYEFFMGTYNRVIMLLFDAKTGKYIKRRIDI